MPAPLYVFDLDGTLLRSDGAVSSFTAAVVEELNLRHAAAAALLCSQHGLAGSLACMVMSQDCLLSSLHVQLAATPI